MKANEQSIATEVAMKKQENRRPRAGSRIWGALMIAGSLCAALDASAFTWSAEGKVSAVVPSELPSQVSFQMFTGSGQCPSGAWLRYRGGTAGEASATKGVLATLTVALLGGRTVRAYGGDDCTIEHVYLLAW